MSRKVYDGLYENLKGITQHMMKMSYPEFSKYKLGISFRVSSLEVLKHFNN